MAVITQSTQEVNDYWATWTHVFQGKNLTFITPPFQLARQIQGNFFIGLQAQPVNMFNTQIPPGATIEAATMDVTAFANSAAGTHTAKINAPKRSDGSQLLDPYQTPFIPFTGWRRDMWSNQELAVVSTTFTFIAQPIGFAVGNANWEMNTFTVLGGSGANRENLAQKITAGSANTTVSFISYQMQRFGNPTGDIICRIQGITTDRGVTIPDGIDIAGGVSTPVAASTLSNTGLSGVIFFYPSNPTLVFGQDYFLVLEVQYPTGLDRIIVGHLNTFLSDGQLYHFGEGLGNDWQNGPGSVDANQWHTVGSPRVAVDTDWDIPPFLIGVTYSTPDITALVQAQIDDPGYTADAGIIISVDRVQTDPLLNRIWRSNFFTGLTDGPVLNVTFREPSLILAGDGGASAATRELDMLLQVLPATIAAIEEIEN
jgi:hypothetical protein